MASTWSALKIELLETGANSGTWGTATNVNLGDAILGEAITGQATVDFATDADVTITLTDSSTSQAARNLRLNITESSSGVGSVRNLILGSGCQIEKFYLINNTGTGAKTVKNTSGTGISVPAGKATLVFNNGTNVVDAASYFTSLTLGSALPVASGGTGLTAGTSGGVLAYTASGTLASSAALTQYGVVYGGGAGVAPSATANGTTGQVLTATTSGAPSWASPATSGTVTSVAVSGGTTGLTTSGGPITTSGTVTLAGTVATTNGGTGLTSFTSGGVVYASSTSALATGSALTFDGTNFNSTGIVGSTNANGLRAYLLANTGYYAQVSNESGNAVWSAVGGNDAFSVFKIAGAEGMRLTSTGLGIGTSSPAYKLDVQQSGTAVARIGTTNGSGSPGSALILQGSVASKNWLIGSSYYATSGGLEFTPSTTNGGTTFTTPSMTLDASGNLGLGTTSPTGFGAGYTVLDVYNGTNGGYLLVRNPTVTGQIAADGSVGMSVQTRTNHPIYFSTNNSEKARISAAGGFSVGTTADPGAGAIYATGNITAYYSDARLKTVSGKIENALDKVAQLSGVYYTNNSVAKSFGYDSDEVQVGVLAQDVEAVLPQIVKAAPFDLDEHGNSKSGENYKTVQYERLVPLLIEAINELQAKVKALESK